MKNYGGLIIKDKTSKDNLKKATFGAGCFWGVEESFRKVEGVISTRVGYMGGVLPDPTYEDVCTGKTGHTEVVEVMFDPQIVSYDQLLHVFWGIHDPTTLNRQGPDIGIQYRSVIFYHDSKQKEKALKSREALEKSGIYNQTIVTALEPAATFYPAEDYHQQYLQKQGLKSCRF